jgi:serine/threonine protein kinase
MVDKTEEVISLWFQNREETLKLYNSNNSILSYLGDTTNPVCRLLGSSIKLDKKLGEGAYGKVFSVVLNDGDKKKYVAKVVDKLVYNNNPADDLSLDVWAKHVSREIPIDPNIIINFNGGNPNVKPRYILIPTFMADCVTTSPRKYKSTYDKHQIVVSPKTYICGGENPMLEYLFGILTGNLYRSGTSINFLDTFAFASCLDGLDKGAKVIEQTKPVTYMFSQQLNNDWDGIDKCLYGEKKSDYKTDLTVQVIHAIAVLQERYQIVHGDLKTPNILVEYVTSATMWQGKRIQDYDYFEYIVGNKSIYMKATPVIVKITDYGLSQKYSDPQILSQSIMDIEFNDFGEPIIPNWFDKTYDLAFHFWYLRHNVPFAEECLCWIYGIKYTDRDRIKKLSKFFTSNRRPKGTLPPSQEKSPYNLLLDSHIMKKYYTIPPPGSSILTIGKC